MAGVSVRHRTTLAKVVAGILLGLGGFFLAVPQMTDLYLWFVSAEPTLVTLNGDGQPVVDANAMRMMLHGATDLFQRMVNPSLLYAGFLMTVYWAGLRIRRAAR
ncbi:MAG: hypothetical protein AAFY65_12440 [Pseudomonadota bacterium]